MAWGDYSLIHSIDTTSANVHDIIPAGDLLQGDKQRVFGDAGYLGIQKRGEHKVRKNLSWFIAKRPCSRKKLDDRKLKVEKQKASARAKMEHHSGTPNKHLATAKFAIAAWPKTATDCTCWPRSAIC